MHALIQDNQIVETGPLPLPSWPDGTRWWWTADPEQRALAGWVEIVEQPRPADTATTTWDRDEPRLIDGIPTVTWTERPKTAEEVAADQAAANAIALTTGTKSDNPKIEQAITALATLLGDDATTGSIRAWKQPITNNQNLTGAQGKALADLLIADAQATRRIARQVLRLAKLLTNDTSSADVGTE